jgi:hypothetical protein
MIMMPYDCPWSSPQLTGQADFWHPTGLVHHVGEELQKGQCDGS